MAGAQHGGNARPGNHPQTELSIRLQNALSSAATWRTQGWRTRWPLQAQAPPSRLTEENAFDGALLVPLGRAKLPLSQSMEAVRAADAVQGSFKTETSSPQNRDPLHGPRTRKRGSSSRQGDIKASCCSSICSSTSHPT